MLVMAVVDADKLGSSNDFLFVSSEGDSIADEEPNNNSDAGIHEHLEHDALHVLVAQATPFQERESELHEKHEGRA